VAQAATDVQQLVPMLELFRAGGRLMPA